MVQIPPLSSIYEPALDHGYMPDFVLRRGIRHLLSRRISQLAQADKTTYIKGLKERKAIADNTAEANEQHYEVPTEFFRLCLGERMKYSCCLFEDGANTLEEAEIKMLDLYVARAGLTDGMSVLDLGCGWGSLSLYLAEVGRSIDWCPYMVASLPCRNPVEVPQFQGHRIVKFRDAA